MAVNNHHNPILAVDIPFNEFARRSLGDDAEQEPRDLVRPDERAQRGACIPAAVHSGHDLGCQGGDEIVEVAGCTSVFEGADHDRVIARIQAPAAGVGTNVTASGDRKLAACCRRSADDVCDVIERDAEDVVQDEGDPFCRCDFLEQHKQRSAHGLVQGDVVKWVAAVVAAPKARGDEAAREGFGEPVSDVGFAAHPGGSQMVQADSAGDPDQPGSGCDDRRAVVRV